MELEALIQFIDIHPYWVYGFFAVFSSLQGPVLSMLGGILLNGGYLSFLPLYVALMIGDLIGDTLWYCIGRFMGEKFIRKYGKYFSINEKEVHVVEKIFHKYHAQILIISKITMGFGFALVTLFTAGLVKIPYKKYMLMNALGQFVWTGIMIAVGYAFGNIYLSVDDILSKMTLIGLLITLFALVFGFGKYIKKRITESTKI